MSATTSDSSMQSFLAEHPKMTGVLFTILLLLTQAGTVLGANSSACAGP